MIELVVFFLPIITGIWAIYPKVMKAEESAIRYVDFENKHGAKSRILNSPSFIIQMCAYIAAPLYISSGWVWFTLGCIFLIWLCTYLIFGDGKTVTPDLCSTEFDEFILKRKKQAITGSLVLVMWVISWVVEYS